MGISVIVHQFQGPRPQYLLGSIDHAVLNAVTTVTARPQAEWVERFEQNPDQIQTIASYLGRQCHACCERTCLRVKSPPQNARPYGCADVLGDAQMILA
jgi:hypothetical protein